MTQDQLTKAVEALDYLYLLDVLSTGEHARLLHDVRERSAETDETSEEAR